jgi:hypothetical protein
MTLEQRAAMTIPINPASGPDIAFQHHLAEGRFMLQRGKTTGNYFYFPRSVGPAARAPIPTRAARPAPVGPRRLFYVDTPLFLPSLVRAKEVLTRGGRRRATRP